MSDALPKEQMTAYMRWEMASFDPPPPVVAPPAEPALSSDEIEALREAARNQGRAEGYADGHAAGRDAGWEQGLAEAAVEIAHLRELTAALGGEIALADEHMKQQLLDLALDIAKAMLKTALPLRPELVLPVVADAIRYLPMVQQPAVLYLHPADAVLVRQQLDDELARSGWRVVDDLHIERGGCRVETASNQIDASVQTRWQRIAGALSSDTQWLTP